MAAKRKGQRARIELTSREVDVLHSILWAVLTNGDQWDSYDLAALRRADNKIVSAMDLVRA